jgi:hypothetical protein
MATSQSCTDRLDMPISGKKDHREQFTKKLVKIILEANFELKRSQKYLSPTHAAQCK